MSTPVKVSRYNWIGIAYTSAVTDIPTSAIPDNFFVSADVPSSTSNEQSYVGYLSGANYQ